MNTPGQGVAFPKLSPTPSDGRITLLNVGRNAVKTLKWGTFKQIFHYAIQDDNKRRARSKSPKKQPRDGKEVGGQGKGKKDKKATVNGLTLLG